MQKHKKKLDLKSLFNYYHICIVFLGPTELIVLLNNRLNKCCFIIYSIGHEHKQKTRATNNTTYDEIRRSLLARALFVRFVKLKSIIAIFFLQRVCFCQLMNFLVLFGLVLLINKSALSGEKLSVLVFFFLFLGERVETI
jgi:hypothetical protein